MKVDVAEEIARRWWEDVWELGDFDALDDLLTDPFTRHTSAGTIVAPVADYKHVLRSVQRSIHRPHTTIDDRHIDPIRIWTRATSRGLDLDSGRQVILSWLLVQRIADGRIPEQWVLTARDIEW